MNKKTKIGVIGLGSIAQVVHLPILEKLTNVEIHSVAEINKSRLNSIADKYSIDNKFTDYKALINNKEIDAVVITTPTDTHYRIAIDSLNAGKHILIEKPVTRTFNEAKEINDLAQKKKKIAMVGMNLRFRPDAMLLKSLLSSGDLGDIFYINCSWLKKKSVDQNWFLQKNKSGGGVIIDLGILLLDFVTWLIDVSDIKTVSVQAFKHRTKDVEDSAVGLIRLKGDKVINFEVSWSLHSEKDSLNLAAFGSNGTAHLSPLKAYKKVGESKIDYAPSINSNSKNLYKKSYENELKHFIGAINQNIGVISSVEEAMNRMQMLEWIYESVQKKREINCNQ